MWGYRECGRFTRLVSVDLVEEILEYRCEGRERMSTRISGGSSLQAEEPPVQMQEVRRVSVIKEEPGGRCGWRNEELR